VPPKHTNKNYRGGIASIVRIVYFKAIINTDLDFFGMLDFLASVGLIYFSAADRSSLVDILSLALWSAIEPGLCILAGSLAALRPLAKTISNTWGSWKGSTHRTRSRSDRSHKLDGREVKKWPTEKDISLLDDTQTTAIDSIDMRKDSTSLAVGDEGSKEPVRNQALLWWRLPSFPVGLMTEFCRATRDIQLQTMTRDVEAGR
jgi:hypothetical protein